MCTVNCVFRNMAPRLVKVTVYPSPARLITGGGRKEGMRQEIIHALSSLRGAAGSAYEEREGAGGIASGRMDREGWDGLSIIQG